ncbi:hypothetical protein BSKO_10097 [Bryopsis sp. KO-2023]|nr:hypothetical protein BSKO_10097 [Bryopsis sp. KO-2023]
MAQSSYTKSLTGAAVLLVILGTTLCEARRLRQTEVISSGPSSFQTNPGVNAPPVDFDSLFRADFNLLREIAEAENAATERRNTEGRRLLAVNHGEVTSTGGSSVSTAGRGSASTSSQTEVSVSPAISKTGKRAGSATSGGSGSDTFTTSSFTSASSGEGSIVGVPTAGKGNPRFNTGSQDKSATSGVDILHTGVQAADDSSKHIVPGAGVGNPRFQTGSGGSSSKQTAAEVVESEVVGPSKDTVVDTEEPAPAGSKFLFPEFSGSGVSIDLETSSSSRGTRISAGSRSTGRKSASSSIGLSVGGGAKPHKGVVPVPASAETDHE